MNRKWFGVSSLIFIIPVLFLLQQTGKYFRIMKFKRVFQGWGEAGEDFYTKHVGGNFWGGPQPLDNILKKLIQGYQFCCFPLSNRYTFFLQLFSNMQAVLFSWTDIIALFI